MKTLRYRIGKEVKPGILDSQGHVRDAASLVKDWDKENVTINKLNEVKKVTIIFLPFNLIHYSSNIYRLGKKTH